MAGDDETYRGHLRRSVPANDITVAVCSVLQAAYERREITKYTASKSMGLKHNGLWPDANGAVITLPGWLMATDTPIGHTHQCAHGDRDAHNGALALLPAPAA